MWRKSWPWVFLILVLSVFSFKSLLRPGYFPMHDDMQAMRVLQIDKCVKDGQIPCRWVPDMGYGYGYPQFIYYSPLPYYVMEIFHLGGMQIVDSVKAGIVLGFILSGLAMFLLGRSLWGNLGGLVSSIFYVFAPYHASDIYTRGAMGEFWALVFLPLIFWAIYEFVQTEKQKYMVFLALSTGGLLITHNITSVAFFPVAGLWALFLLFRYQKSKLWKKLFLSFLWGAGLAGFFLLPVIFEKKFVHVETMISGYFNYLAHFVSLKQLFFFSHWGYGSSELGPYDDLSFFIGTMQWVFSLIALVTAFVFRKKEKVFPIVIFLFLTALAATFMTHQRSSFIWSKVSLLSYFQFPWRFLTIVTFATSILSGYVIYNIKNKKTGTLLCAFMIFLVLLLNGFYFRPREWYDIGDKEKFSGSLWEKELTISIYDYLPIYAKFPPDKEAPLKPIVTEGMADFSSYTKGSDWQRGEAIVSSEKAKIVLPLYYFPGFKVWVDGKEVKTIDHNNDLGLISFYLENGSHEVYAKLLRTPVRVLGDCLSLGSILILVFVIFKKRIKTYV